MHLPPLPLNVIIIKMGFRSSSEVFSYLDKFVSANVWSIPKHMREQRLLLIAEAAGHPERCAPAFHIAGSKGKGSVTSLLTAMLGSAGQRAAQYLSPHVSDPRERIMLGRSYMDEAVYASAGEEVRRLAETLQDTSRGEYKLFHGNEAGCYPPTYFELLSFYFFFCARATDAQVMSVETGMGGRFDPTNVVEPLISIITVIELEHTAFLGESIEKIAFEKAGIIKAGRPVITASQEEGALNVFRETAAAKKAPFYYLPDIISIENLEITRQGTSFTLVPKTNIFDKPLKMSLPVPGHVYAENTALAAAALKIALPSINDAIILGALRSFSMPARFEKVSDNPPTVVDGAHTALSAANAVKDWAMLYGAGGVLLFGCAEDKDAPAMAHALVPYFSGIFITSPGNYKKGRPGDVYNIFADKARRLSSPPEVKLEPNTDAAINAAFEQACSKNLPLFCTGSFYLAALVRQAARKTNKK